MKKLRKITDKFPNWVQDLLKNLYRIFMQSFVVFCLMMSLTVPMVWYLTSPIATHIQADIVVNHFAFRVDKPIALGAIKFQSAMVEDFDKIIFSLADSVVEITANDMPLDHRVTFSTVTPSSKQFGVLDTLLITPDSEVSLDLEAGENGTKELVITVNNVSEQLANFRQLGKFDLEAEECEVKGIESLAGLELSEEKPFIQITGKSLRLVLTVVGDKDFEIMPSDAVVTAVDLIEREMVDGEVVARTSLIMKGNISYPAYPQISTIEFRDSNFFFLGEKDSFKVKRVYFDIENGGFGIRLTGLAENRVATHPVDFVNKSMDYRLTRFETLTEESKFLKLLLGIIVWLIPAIIGIVGIVIVGRVKVAVIQDEQHNSVKRRILRRKNYE
ncbi:MAG: hypothetical protein QM487_05265 [Candidatus Marithrix sp.]